MFLLLLPTHLSPIMRYIEESVTCITRLLHDAKKKMQYPVGVISKPSASERENQMLTNIKLAEYRRILQDEFCNLKSQDYETDESALQAATSARTASSDPADRANDWLLVYEWKQKVGRRNASMQQVQHALRLLSEGVYGYCEQCGEGISPERLDCIPSATLCASCCRERSVIGARHRSPEERTTWTST